MSANSSDIHVTKLINHRIKFLNEFIGQLDGDLKKLTRWLENPWNCMGLTESRETQRRADYMFEQLAFARRQKSEIEVARTNWRDRGCKLPTRMEKGLLNFYNNSSSSKFTTVVYLDSQERLIAELRDLLTSWGKEIEILRKQSFSPDSKTVPVAREKVSVTFTPATPGYVNTNVFASPAPPTHQSAPDTFDRYLKHQGVPSFTPAGPPPRILFEGESSPPNQVSDTPKLTSGSEDAEQECPSEYPSEFSSTSSDSEPIPEDTPTPEDDCCIKCCSCDCYGDCSAQGNYSSDAEGEGEDIDPRSCEEIWASCYAVGDDFECMSEDEDCRTQDEEHRLYEDDSSCGYDRNDPYYCDHMGNPYPSSDDDDG